MKNILFILLSLPAVAFAQPRFYCSADAGIHFGKFLEQAAYGATASANAEVAPRLYAGLAAGVVQVQPFIQSVSFPVMGRITFFTAAQEDKVMPFGLFEAGKLFFKDDKYNNTAGQTMTGQLAYYAGVGMRLPSQRNLHFFFALGLAGFNYNLHVYTGPNTVAYDRPYRYQRFSVRAGLMIPHH